jgi:hypothetical protein
MSDHLDSTPPALATAALARDLVTMIRAARSLEDLAALQRFVGPSADGVVQAAARVRRLEALTPHCRWGIDAPGPEAEQARTQWQRLMEEQAAFENRYL